MSFIDWLIAAAIAMLPFSASAREQQENASPAAPEAPVAAFKYVSAFQDYRPAADSRVSPDQSWRAANASVTEEKQMVAVAPAPSPAPARVAPAKAVHLHAQDGHHE